MSELNEKDALTDETPVRFQIQDGTLHLEAALSKMHPFFAQGMMRHMCALIEAWYAKRAQEGRAKDAKIVVPGRFQAATQSMKNFVLGLKH